MNLKILDCFYRKTVIVFIIFNLFFTSTPFAVYANDCSYDDDPAFALQKEECASQADKQWDCNLNRCITKDDVKALRTDYEICAEMPQDTAEENLAKRRCFTAVAEKHAGLDKVENKKLLDQARSGLSAANATLIIINLAARRGSGQLCLPNIVFLAAALAGIAVELYVGLKINKDLTEYSEEYTAIVEDNYNGQLQSFEYLKKQQQAIYDAADTKYKAYIVLSAVYGVAAFMALLDMMGLTSCKQPGEEIEDAKEAIDKANEVSDLNGAIGGDAAPATDVDTRALEQVSPGANPDGSMLDLKTPQLFKEVKDPEHFLLSLIFPSAQAKDSVRDLVKDKIDDASAKKVVHNKNTTTENVKILSNNKSTIYAMLFGAGAGIVLGIFPFLARFFTQMLGLFIMAGISTTLSIMTVMEMKEQKEVAKNNIKLLDEIIEQMKNDLAIFCPEPTDWDDLSKPRCYCYKPNGDKNTDRENSATCQTYWAKDSMSYYISPTKYAVLNGSRYACFDNEGNYDPTCDCNKTNTCSQASFASAQLGLGNTKSILQPLEDELNKFTKGDFESSNVTDSKFQQSAAKIDDLASAMFAAYKKDQEEKGNFNSLPFKDEAFINRQISSIGGKVGRIDGVTKNALQDVSLPLNTPALKEAQKKLEQKKSEYEGGNQKAKDDKKKNIFSGIKLDNLGGQVLDNFKEAEKEELEKKMNFNDIEKDEGTSIWVILSRRYIASGLKRLFEEDTSKSKGKSK